MCSSQVSHIDSVVTLISLLIFSPFISLCLSFAYAFENPNIFSAAANYELLLVMSIIMVNDTNGSN